VVGGLGSSQVFLSVLAELKRADLLTVFPKNCTHKFDDVAQDRRFRFFGNVNIGDGASPIPHSLSLPTSSILHNYSHVLFATGCTMPTLHSALPPSQYCVPAISIVHWYTHHANAPPPPPLDTASHVSIIGNGNVSLDVARILLTNVDFLSKYDLPQSVLEVLSRSKIKHVSIIGRRGPLEAAFTMKELREMMNLSEASMVPVHPSLLAPSMDSPPLTRQQSRILQLIQQGSKNPPGSTLKTWSLDFFRSPVGLTPPTSTTPAQLSLAHTVVDPTTRRAISTGEVSTIATDLVVTSLGFHAEVLQDFYDPTLRHLRSVAGRLVNAKGEVFQNAYASGWASTGAKGVLASTMMNAYGVTDTIIADWKAPFVDPPVANPQDSTSNLRRQLNFNPVLDDIPEEVQTGLRDGKVTQYEDWKKVDAEELRRGKELGKERERMGWLEAHQFLRG